VSIISQNNQGCVPLCPSFTCVTSAGATISWIFGNGSTGTSITSSACYNTPADYIVISNVTDVNGCSNNSTFTVNAYPIPVADFNYAPIKPIANDDVAFTDASYGANITAWNWYFMSTAAQQSSAQNPVFNYADAGAYAITLIAKSENGCIDTVTKTILVGEDFGIFVPNAFTPNADGLNDIFFAKGFGIVKFKMEIFDRWGEKVFTGNDINDSWDGTFQLKGNKILQDGVYSWRIELTDVYGKSKELTGHVTLIK
ncbi:MAG: T9SS type B sorting domain-containing protein, partial [Bacteroidia bacterium]